MASTSTSTPTPDIQNLNLEDLLLHLTKNIHKLVLAAQLRAAEHGAPPSLMKTWVWLDKTNNLVWALQTRIELSSTWQEAAEKLGEPGLNLLREANQLAMPLSKDSELDVDKKSLKDIGDKLTEACLRYLGKEEEVKGEVDHDMLKVMLRGW